VDIIKFVTVRERTIPLWTRAVSLKAHFELDFSRAFLPRRMDHFLAADEDACETPAYACHWRPDPRRRDATRGHGLYER